MALPRLLPALILALAPSALMAADGTPLDAAGFEARTVGKTITYYAGGQPYGVEQYLPGRRVVWAFTERECKEGTWFQSDKLICFDYHDDNGLQCWTFFDSPQGLVARFQGSDETEPLVSLQESNEPLACPGPDIGA